MLLRRCPFNLFLAFDFSYLFRFIVADTAFTAFPASWLDAFASFSSFCCCTCFCGGVHFNFFLDFDFFYLFRFVVAVTTFTAFPAPLLDAFASFTVFVAILEAETVS